MIEKKRIQELVEIFYHQPFKIFYVNSTDNSNFIKPVGLFISLGITTPMTTLELLRSTIDNTYPETSPRIVELMSRRVNGNYYLNSLTSNPPQPYVVSELPKNRLGEEEAKEELLKLREKIKESSPKVEDLVKTQRLQELLDRISWDTSLIYKTDDGEYKLFHIISNYIKKGDVEFRIGIYVE